MHVKFLLKRMFKEEFVDTGIVSKFSVKWDKSQNDFAIIYTPASIKNLDDIPEIEIENEDIEIINEGDI